MENLAWAMLRGVWRELGQSGQKARVADQLRRRDVIGMTTLKRRSDDDLWSKASNHPGELLACCAVVDDARVRQLNARYRAKNTRTDVLSFAAEEAGFLGEVVIASGVARRQARQAGHPVQVELRVLARHGLLHLLGYDHERDDGRMARVERRLRRKGGLREGLIERGRQ